MGCRLSRPDHVSALRLPRPRSSPIGEAVATVLVNLSSQPASLGEAAREVSGKLILSNRDLPEEDRGVPETLGEWEARVYLV